MFRRIGTSKKQKTPLALKGMTERKPDFALQTGWRGGGYIHRILCERLSPKYTRAWASIKGAWHSKKYDVLDLGGSGVLPRLVTKKGRTMKEFELVKRGRPKGGEVLRARRERKIWNQMNEEKRGTASTAGDFRDVGWRCVARKKKGIKKEKTW